MLFECKTQHLFRAFCCSLKVFRSGSCLEEIWKQRPFGCAVGSEEHQPVSFCLLVQLSLCLPPSSFSHSSCPSRNKDTFPAEHSCGSRSPNKYGSWVLTAAADLWYWGFGHVSAVRVLHRSRRACRVGQVRRQAAPAVPFAAEPAEDGQLLQVQLAAAGVHTL